MTAIAMSQPRRRSTTDHILRTAARGAALIGVAVVIGIVLLQVVDSGGGGTGGSATPATSSGGDDTTSTTSADSGRPPQEVRVLVQNGSGVAMAAATKANELRGLGYAIAGTGNAAVQQGSTVACLSGFESEAEALAKQVGSGTTVTAFPTPVPAGAEATDCIVVIGKP
jgi:hypothetical protein